MSFINYKEEHKCKKNPSDNIHIGKHQDNHWWLDKITGGLNTHILINFCPYCGYEFDVKIS
jgi:hypothetical protein